MSDGGSTATVAVVIATRARATEVAVLLDRLEHGTRRPDRVVIVGGSPDDWGQAGSSPLMPETLVAAEPGLPRQRNVGVRYLLEGAGLRPDAIVFFDDDFRPEYHWLEAAMTVFATHPDVAGLTGIVLCDGARTAAIEEGMALGAIAAWHPPSGASIAAVPRLYGCNMAVRTTVFDHAVFDERLPLYGWLEDLDFSGQLCGRLVTARRCGGVHLGSKSGRVSGRRYGYSQIVNPLYLAGKGTCSKRLAAMLVLRALASNSLRSLWHHPVFDYRGRLRGNIGALLDLVQRRAVPERILEL